MQNFLVRYRINNKSIEEEIVAASEKEALEMTKLQAGWDFPRKKIAIISIKSLKKIKG